MAAHSEVKMFVCGPTVYDYVHLGHARTYLAFDTITRYLHLLGYRVRYLMNITDVAERIVERADNLKRDPLDLAREFEAAFLEDMAALGITQVDKFYRASDAIPQMIAQVAGLIQNGAAYQSETGVYFDVEKDPTFGALSGQSPDELSLRRLELCSSKRKPEDFSLWRRYDKGLAWDSPWGRGRPGWHIEDTSISMQELGDTYDIHGGASELIFPHHEAEIAQAEALTGKRPFVKYWLHTGLLNVGSRKMSKSLGNMIRIRDILRDFTPAELRFYFASTHNYREPMIFSQTGLEKARSRLNKLQKDFNQFKETPSKGHDGREIGSSGKYSTYANSFEDAMNDDFNTPTAVRHLEAFASKLAKDASKLNEATKTELESRFRENAQVFGILA